MKNYLKNALRKHISRTLIFLGVVIVLHLVLSSISLLFSRVCYDTTNNCFQTFCQRPGSSLSAWAIFLLVRVVGDFVIMTEFLAELTFIFLIAQLINRLKSVITK
jgi:hypothetical protein